MSIHQKFVYEINRKTKKLKLAFTGQWSRADVDRMHQNATKGLRQHKHDLRRSEEDERRKQEPAPERDGDTGDSGADS